LHLCSVWSLYRGMNSGNYDQYNTCMQVNSQTNKKLILSYLVRSLYNNFFFIYK